MESIGVSSFALSQNKKSSPARLNMRFSFPLSESIWDYFLGPSAVANLHHFAWENPQSPESASAQRRGLGFGVLFLVGGLAGMAAFGDGTV